MNEVELLERAPTRYALAKSTADNLTSVYSSPTIPVLEIAEANGVDVIFTDFGKFSSQISGFCDFAEAKLFVNIEDNTSRKLFTIAHELGHWLLHRDVFIAHPDIYPVLPRFKSGDVNNRFEREANSFAANLLVPEKLLSPVRHFPVAVLAQTFGVSRSMMENRLKNG